MDILSIRDRRYPSSVKKAFRDHYEARFNKPTTTRLKLSFPFPKRLSTVQVDDLERGVSHDEIRSAVWDCGDNKSPGPDGFTFEFFKKYWRFIGPDFCEAVEHFFQTSILVNGSPSDEFHLHCGLKQGDPLSPYLFILVMESLHLSVSRAVDEGVFKGIRLHGSLSLSHLFFADDALFMGEWSDSNLRGIIYILKCFFLASGLKINIQKSQVLGVGVPRSSVESMASSLGCSIMEKKFRYLGVMVGERMSHYKAWDDVVLKLKTRLSKWKAKTFLIGGHKGVLKWEVVRTTGIILSYADIGFCNAFAGKQCGTAPFLSSDIFCVKEVSDGIDDMAFPPHTSLQGIEDVSYSFSMFFWPDSRRARPLLGPHCVDGGRWIFRLWTSFRKWEELKKSVPRTAYKRLCYVEVV
ncbi:RNA-directed DNA polymerase, eukaryota [Tanacetum coccineum]|uniref:RNA-directed DNA polymerase, eukaryota n=1 Tax=Tanacetum coccineum TaxID=301880 RepID=A0ABQ5EGN5_9ASTR